MKARLVAALLSEVWLALLATAAVAQTFGPPVRTERVLKVLARDGNVRFTLGTYYIAWQNPFQLTVTTFSIPRGQPVTGTFRVLADTPASPLVEGIYVLGRRWSLGFWYNPIRGERLRRQVTVMDTQVTLDYQRNTDLSDLHLVYYAPHGLSAQLGYYRESGSYKDLRVAGLPPTHYTMDSWNLWLTERLDSFTPHGWVVDRLTAQVIPFISLGYHPSSSLHHAASLQLGLGITVRDRLSLSGSVWWFDLAGPDTAIRVTAGLVYQR